MCVKKRRLKNTLEITFSQKNLKVEKAQAWRCVFRDETSWTTKEYVRGGAGDFFF